MDGCIFDIKQMAVFDGPGIRTTVFLKGCPLHCRWCHNPEGLSFRPELMVAKHSCTHCGACEAVCEHPEGCVLCGRCVRACPNHLRRICGTMMSPEALSEKLLKDRRYLEMSGGGVTFSGGEPAAQAPFLIECLDRLSKMHRAIETSGYCDPEVFREIIRRLDYIIMDIKIVDGDLHRKYTGVDNGKILENLRQVKESGKPFRIRIPVIPDVNDSEENFRAAAALLTDCDTLDFVELLPYHRTAGAKYEMVNRIYISAFDETKSPNLETAAFAERGIECRTI